MAKHLAVKLKLRVLHSFSLLAHFTPIRESHAHQAQEQAWRQHLEAVTCIVSIVHSLNRV